MVGKAFPRWARPQCCPTIQQAIRQQAEHAVEYDLVFLTREPLDSLAAVLETLKDSATFVFDVESQVSRTLQSWQRMGPRQFVVIDARGVEQFRFIDIDDVPRFVYVLDQLATGRRNTRAADNP